MRLEIRNNGCLLYDIIKLWLGIMGSNLNLSMNSHYGSRSAIHSPILTFFCCIQEQTGTHDEETFPLLLQVREPNGATKICANYWCMSKWICIRSYRAWEWGNNTAEACSINHTPLLSLIHLNVFQKLFSQGCVAIIKAKGENVSEP